MGLYFLELQSRAAAVILFATKDVVHKLPVTVHRATVIQPSPCMEIAR